MNTTTTTTRDQLPEHETKIRNRVTPMHHDPMEINCRSRGRQAKINGKVHGTINRGSRGPRSTAPAARPC